MWMWSYTVIDNGATPPMIWTLSNSTFSFLQNNEKTKKSKIIWISVDCQWSRISCVSTLLVEVHWSPSTIRIESRKIRAIGGLPIFQQLGVSRLIYSWRIVPCLANVPASSPTDYWYILRLGLFATQFPKMQFDCTALCVAVLTTTANNVGGLPW